MYDPFSFPKRIREKNLGANQENVLRKTVAAWGWYLPFIQYHDTKNCILAYINNSAGSVTMEVIVLLHLALWGCSSSTS